MKTISLIVLIAALVLLLCGLICGFWLKGGNAGSASFHVSCCMIGVVLVAVDLVLQIIIMRH